MTRKNKNHKKKLSEKRDDTVQIHSIPTTSTSVQPGNENDSKATQASEAKNDVVWAVGSLSAEEQKEKRAAKAAYSSFWENLKFKKGWDTPLFFQSEIDDLLTQAAEIVARIRVHLDVSNPGFKLRMAEGNAHEFFWAQMEHPRTHPEAFVRELVHQTLKDANGYVEGLSKEVVDKYIDDCLHYFRNQDGSEILRGEVQLLRSKALRQWKGVSALWDATFAEPPPSKEVAPACTIVQLAAYRELTRALDRVQYYVSIVQEEQAKQRQEQGKHEQEAADAKERFEEQTTKRQQLKAALREQLSGGASTASTTQDDAAAKTGEQPNPPSAVERAPSEPLSSPSRQSFTRVPSHPGSPKRLPSDAAEKSEEDDHPAIQKIEELVKEVNVRKTELDRMKDRTEHLQIQDLTAEPLKSQKTVKSLHERCKYLSLELERDLLKLDAIVGGNKVRPLRKAQVRNIQHMLEDVDSINEKLSGLETALLPAVEEEQQRLAEQKAKEEAEAAQAKLEEERRKREEQEKLEEKERELEAQREREREAQRVSLAERWKQLKLQPKFDVQEHRNGYQISAYIPGMRKEDLEITHSGNTLTLSGLRLPSREEELAMGQSLQLRGIPVEDHNLLRLGAGRFGRFQQQYSLPADVDTSGLKATYEAGVFQVTIPRKPRPPIAYPPRGGFFNDRDFWW